MKKWLSPATSLICAAWLLSIQALAQSPAPEQQHWADWRAQRIEDLKGENGWLNLAGRFILAKGRSSFGASKGHKIRFPEGKCADLMGHFVLEKDSVWMEPAPNTQIAVNGNAINGRTLLFPSAQPMGAQSGSLRWFVIQRGDQFIVRLRDLEHPALRDFHGAEFYPYQKTLRVKARLKPSKGKKIAITNVLGQTSLQDSPGTLEFKLNGKTCRLDPMVEGEQLFIVFSDATTGTETYGAGRFLYADKPDKKGRTVLDFNYAVNPPCAFTAFATCPLPPKQNELGQRVEAGEKKH